MASPEETNSPQYTTNSSTPDKSESPKVLKWTLSKSTPSTLSKISLTNPGIFLTFSVGVS